MPSNRSKRCIDQRIYLKSLWQSGEDWAGLRCFVVGVDLWLDWMDTEKGSWTSHIWEDCCEEFSELDTNQPHHQRYSGEEMASQSSDIPVLTGLLSSVERRNSNQISYQTNNEATQPCPAQPSSRQEMFGMKIKWNQRLCFPNWVVGTTTSTVEQ